MAIRASTKRKPVAGADFLRADELAERLSYGGTRALWRAIRDGKVPLPWTYLGERVALWRKDHYEHFRTTGRWPEGVRFQPPV